MTIEIEYKILEYPGDKGRQVQLTGIKAMTPGKLPSEYVEEPTKNRIDCCFMLSSGVLAVHDGVNNEWMSPLSGSDLSPLGYRVGDVLTNNEFDKLVKVVRRCGNRLHTIKERMARGEPRVVKEGCVVV